MRVPLIVNGWHVTVPLADEPTRDLHEWLKDHEHEIGSVLAPYGLTADDVLPPAFEQHLFEGIA